MVRLSSRNVQAFGFEEANSLIYGAYVVCTVLWSRSYSKYVLLRVQSSVLEYEEWPSKLHLTFNHQGNLTPATTNNIPRRPTALQQPHVLTLILCATSDEFIQFIFYLSLISVLSAAAGFFFVRQTIVW